MPNPRLAGRYAKSLLDLAIERGELETVLADILWLQQLCNASAEFVSVLKSPVISNEKKLKVLDAVTAGKISALTAGFNRLLVTKNRESNLPEILAAFVSQYKKYKNIYTVKLTTASALTEAQKNSIVDKVKNVSKMQQIELETSINADLIGGFVLQVGDKLIDASIAYDLKNIARQFENNDFIYKIR
jgi:F-type H+-transporting ATPase subunit delta